MNDERQMQQRGGCQFRRATGPSTGTQVMPPRYGGAIESFRAGAELFDRYCRDSPCKTVWSVTCGRILNTRDLGHLIPEAVRSQDQAKEQDFLAVVLSS